MLVIEGRAFADDDRSGVGDRGLDRDAGDRDESGKFTRKGAPTEAAADDG